jgi:transcriptional regulator with XRE-family HTH domain
VPSVRPNLDLSHGLPPNSQRFLADNVSRLFGLHKLTTREAATLLRVSPQALSELRNRRRTASLHTAQQIARFFEIPLDRLLDAPFADLLAHELAEPDRFASVEAKIKAGPGKG